MRDRSRMLCTIGELIHIHDNTWAGPVLDRWRLSMLHRLSFTDVHLVLVIIVIGNLAQLRSQQCKLGLQRCPLLVCQCHPPKTVFAYVQVLRP